MGKKTRSYLKLDSPINDFSSQNLLSKAENDVCSFSDNEIRVFISKGKFSKLATFRAFDSSLKCDSVSPTWVCFYEYPFSIGLSYPFSPLISEFFKVTGLSYSQVMPMVWRVLSWVDNVNSKTNIGLGLPELASVYNLRTFGSCRFLFKIKPGRDHLVQKVTHHDIGWKGRYFFVKRTSISGGDILSEQWLTKIPKFETLFPATSDTQIKIERWLALPIEDRTFKNGGETYSEEEENSISTSTAIMEKIPTTSKFTRAGPALVFSDVEALISSKAVAKTEGSLLPPSSKRPLGKTISPDSKRKKVLSDEDIFEGLSSADIKRKLVSVTQSAIDMLVKNNEDLKKEMLEMRKKCDEKEEIIEMKNSEMLKMEEDFSKEIGDMASEAKTFAARAVLQARLMMVDNVKTGECSLWDEEFWRQSLKNIEGDSEEGCDDGSKKVKEKKNVKEVVEVKDSDGGKKIVKAGGDKKVVKAGGDPSVPSSS